MPAEKISLGIIGANAHYGWGMRAHLPALQALPEYQLTAVCTSRRETAEESAKHYGARMAFDDYHEMISHPDIELVAVSVRAPLHHQMVMAALEAGKHVFCEWPLGANLAEAEEMASLARSQEAHHMVGLQARGDPALLRLREMVAEGYVGDVVACTMTLFREGIYQRGAHGAWMANRENGASTLSISAGHTIDALCMCVGEFRDVSARVTTQVREWDTGEPGKKVDVNAPDNVLVNGLLANGAVASVHVSSVPWHGSGWRMEIYGREGTLIANGRPTVQYNQNRISGGRGKDGALEELPIPERLILVPRGVPKNEPFNVAQLYRRLAGAIRDGGDGEPTFQLALKRHRLLDAIQRSSDQGTKMPVD